MFKDRDVATLNENEGVKLTNITVYYGKTTLDELFRAGYLVEPELWDYHAESETLMCAFYKDNYLLGDLTFYDIERKPVQLNELVNRPIAAIFLLGHSQLVMENTNVKNNKTNEFHFGYSQPTLSLVLWFIFSLIGLLLLNFIGANDLGIVIVEKYGLLGLLLYILVWVAYAVGLMMGSFVLSEKLTNKKGSAYFFIDYVEITLNNKKIEIPYAEIKKLKCDAVAYRAESVSGYDFMLKTKQHKIRIGTSSQDRKLNQKVESKSYELKVLYDMLKSRLEKNDI